MVSFASQLAFWFGYDLLGSAWHVVFAGIFVVWFPTVWMLRGFQGVMQRKGGWRIAFIGAPDWVRNVVYGSFVFAIANFALGFFGVFSMEGNGFWRVGSSHAMAFYSAAWGLAVAANRREEQGMDWKCRNGHDMTPGAKFCEECGAPAQPSLGAGPR